MSRSLRIAVADDELDMRDFYSRILPRLGHRVIVVASTGADLVAQCLPLRPDLIISDVRMPDMDGLEAARQLARQGPVPVILVTALRKGELKAGPGSDAIVGYLQKPIKQADLAPVIADTIQRFEMHNGSKPYQPMVVGDSG